MFAISKYIFFDTYIVFLVLKLSMFLGLEWIFVLLDKVE